MRQLRPQLAFGPSVHPIDLPRLRRVGITAVLSLQQPDIDLPRRAVERMRAACGEHQIAFHNVGVHDYDPDALIAALPAVLAVLDRLIRGGRTVYVHCTEGINRAPSLALAHLVRHELLDVDTALAELLRCDAGVRPYPTVIAWLRGGFAERPT
ncbi:MAG TPA: dual specificity protein phosphatase family protein [Candidatus Binatia bacterium]|nr:dual specificity protein phosphatase family protein [Candidatus Binatia bacterium]